MESSGTTVAADQAVAVPRIITSHAFLRDSASMSAQRRFAAQETPATGRPHFDDANCRVALARVLRHHLTAA